MHYSNLLRLLPPSQRELARELRHFLRFPLSLRSNRTSGSTVVLYGIPYTDWNKSLAVRSLWDEVPEVSRVVRMPALPSLLRWLAGRDAVVIPMKESHARELPSGVRCLSPRREAVQALADKQRFADYIAANGLTSFCPRTYSSWSEAEFPCVLKRTDYATGYGISVVSSPSAGEALLKSAMYAGRPYVLQEAVPGATDYCTFCVLKNGRLLWSRTFVNDIATPLTIRTPDNVLKRVSMETPESTARQIETVLAPASYSGPCNIDYKLERDRMRIFEINPRLGGSLLQPPFREHLQAALACIVANSTAERT